MKATPEQLMDRGKVERAAEEHQRSQGRRGQVKTRAAPETARERGKRLEKRQQHQ